MNFGPPGGGWGEYVDVRDTVSLFVYTFVQSGIRPSIRWYGTVPSAPEVFCWIRTSLPWPSSLRPGCMFGLALTCSNLIYPVWHGETGPLPHCPSGDTWAVVLERRARASQSTNVRAVTERRNQCIDINSFFITANGRQGEATASCTRE